MNLLRFQELRLTWKNHLQDKHFLSWKKGVGPLEDKTLFTCCNQSSKQILEQLWETLYAALNGCMLTKT